MSDPNPDVHGEQRSSGGAKSTEFRVALITAVIALVVALTTGAFGLWSVSRASGSTASQAHADFLREKRQEAYAALIADTQVVDSDAYSMEQTFQRRIDHPTAFDPVSFHTMYEAFVPAYYKVLTDVGLVQVLGTQTVITRATSVLVPYTYVESAMTVEDSSVQGVGVFGGVLPLPNGEMTIFPSLVRAHDALQAFAAAAHDEINGK